MHCCRGPGQEIIAFDAKKMRTDLDQAKSHRKRLLYMDRCETKIDTENYDDLKYRAYFKGILGLSVKDFANKIVSKVKAKIMEMKRVLQKNPEYAEDKFIKTISFKKFLEMTDTECYNFD